MPSTSYRLLTALPVEVWSLISDYATAPAAERDGSDIQRTCLSSLRCSSRAFNALLTSEEYYQARVADAIKTLDELDTRKSATAGPFKSCGSSRLTTTWPCAESVGGYKNLYHILVSWSPLEGWYTLCDAWPWGYLVLMKFCDGMLCGEVVSVSQQESSYKAPEYDCERERIFEISFNSSGSANCTVIGKKAESFGVKWKGGSSSSSAGNSSYHKVKKSDVFRSLQIRNDLSDDDVFPRNNGLLFHISNILKNEMDADSKELYPDPFSSNMSGVDESMSVPMPTCSDIIGTLLQREMPIYKYKQNIRRQSYVNRLQEYYPNGLLLEYICGPEGRPLGNRAKASKVKGVFQHAHPLQPGFYVGKNDRRFFHHHLRHEVVQLRNHRLQTASSNEPDEIMLSLQESLTASGTDSLPSIVDLVESNNHRANYNFVSGRKVTGDIYVPTGELTWIAITSPLRDMTMFPSPPKVLVKGSQCHQVTNAWPGWKQLARPFYCDSSWKEGWLLELRGTKDADDEWDEGFKYCDETQYVFWLPEEQHRNYFILSKLPCHFGSYLWDV